MGAYIDSLDTTYPDGSIHKVFVLDDDIKDMKSKLKATFPVLTGPVTATHTELNYLVGVAGNIQAQINAASATLATLTAKGSVKSGKIDGNGTAVSIPAGWTSTRLSTGRYRITHNVGVTVYPAANIDISSVGDYWRYAINISTIGTSYFTLLVIADSSPADAGFYFLVNTP